MSIQHFLLQKKKKPVGVQEGGATVHYLELVMRSDNASGAAAIVKRPQVRSYLVFSCLFIVKNHVVTFFLL